MTIPVIHHLVAQMLNVMMELVHASLNSKEILIWDVDQNAFSIQSVLETKPAQETNVLILVLELVDKMPFAMCLIIYQCAVVRKEWMEMHLLIADHSNVCI